MLAQAYRCPKHGEVWRVTDYNEIDTEHDEVTPIKLCCRCYNEVTPIIQDGIPVMMEVPDEELAQECDPEDEWPRQDDNDEWSDDE